MSTLPGSHGPVKYWRFRTLPCFRWLQPSTRSTGGTSTPGVTPVKRWAGYRRRPLTAAATLTYIARIAAFTLFRRLDSHGGYRVCNRYFYDNFPQFTVTTRRQRSYRALLRALTPKPDVALVMVATPRTLAERRPTYSSEYFQELGRAYGELNLWCDGLVEVSTEPGSDVATTAQIVQRILKDARR
jgi:hypothetical protein